jgi:nucleoid-associated protein YgaU
MTSDAKIGLLLGLVFIFVIAFVINGLPSFRQATNNSELTTNMVSSQQESWGIGTNERKVQDGYDWAGQPIEEPVEEEIASLPVEEKKEDVRFEMPIPGNIAIVEETSIQITPDLIEQTLIHSIDPAVMPVAEQTTPEPVETIVFELPPAEMKPEPRPSRRVVPKVYVATKGDTLSSIAKKCYGPVEGNKIANVRGIFEANHKLLKSEHDVAIGQKLIVPPLRAPKSLLSKTDGIGAKSFFEEAKQIGRRLFSGDKPKPKPKAKPATQYIVKDGDYLWRVAAAQLGDSTRYKEIIKLNPGVLKNENSTLKIGMHLNLPTQ